MRGGGLLHWFNNQDRLTNATTNSDTTSYVSVGEIWNAENGTFNENTFNTLLQYITNNSSLTASAVTTKGSINMTKTSADIRSNTVNGKTTSQDVQVTFGGLTWQVVYLTKDKQGNDIVTLWLSNNKQEAWAGRSATEGTLYGFIDGALYSDWAYDWALDTPSSNYPSNMYSTSYIHSVTLNNGGSYANNGGSSTTSVGQSESSVFAMFTMGDVAGSVKKYLVIPKQVGYQETENANTQFNNSYYYPNEAYGTPGGNGKWYNSSYNYSSKTGYADWADDTLWLPSWTETGFQTGYEGIWQTSTSQRANSTGSNSSMGNVGTTSGSASNYSWLRSGSLSNAPYACTLYASGSNGTTDRVSSSYAVRPALHLNLNAAAQNVVDAAKRTWDGTSTEAPSLQNPSASNSETNPYIIDTAAKLAWISANYNNSNCYGKHYLQTENLDLAGHPWTPINNVTSTSSSNQRAYYYDGGEHTISNLYINTAEQTLTSNNFIGLFGYVRGSSSKHAYIKNLGIVGGSVSGNNNVGAVVGYAYYIDITSCYNEGVSVTGSSYVGGVVGDNRDGTISNSYNEGDVTGSSNYVGGVAGYNRETISNSYNTGNVTGNNQVGGVAGRNEGTISNSYNTGVVIGTGNYVGGVAGYNSSGTISNSYNTGAVTGSGNYSYVGGVAGYNSYGTISNSYNTGDVTGTRYVGGVAGYVLGSSSSSLAIVSSCYSTGEIIRSSGSSTYIGGVVGYIDSYYPSQYVSISWCYYNKETSGSVVTKAIGRGTGYQCYGLTTTEMQGAQNENWMYLSSTFWNFASGQYPTLKYVAKL